MRCASLLDAALSSFPAASVSLLQSTYLPLSAVFLFCFKQIETTDLYSLPNHNPTCSIHTHAHMHAQSRTVAHTPNPMHSVMPQRQSFDYLLYHISTSPKLRPPPPPLSPSLPPSILHLFFCPPHIKYIYIVRLVAAKYRAAQIYARSHHRDDARGP